MTKFTLKRNVNPLPKKLERLKHEVRTQPITTVLMLGTFAFALSKCVSPDAEAASMEVIEVVTPTPYVIPEKISSVDEAKIIKVTSVDFKKIGKGKKLNPLMGAYFGMAATKDRPAILPASKSIDWGDNLKKLWDRKVRIANATPATVNNAESIVLDYTNAPRDTKSIEVFVSHIGEVSRNTHASINYSTLCVDMKIKAKSCPAFKTIMGRINGINIAAYGMTELFPSHNGAYNVAALDTILQHGGENYIDAIPALGDRLLSKGLYQFTSLAIRRDGSGKLGGANFVDNHAGMKLPGSVLYLKGRDSHKAAFEFAAYNVGNLVRKLSDTETEVFKNQCPTDDMTQFIAISHHMPTRSVKYGKTWVSGGCKKPLITYLDKHLTEYAYKTKQNYLALKGKL